MASADDLPPLDGVDVGVGLGNAGGSRDLYLKVLKNVHKRYRDIDEQIIKEVDRKSFDSAHRLAHTFKGVSGTIGAMGLHKKSLDLESVLQKREVHRIADVSASLAQEVKRVMAALESFIRQQDHIRVDAVQSKKTPEAIDAERLKTILGQLSKLIHEGDSEALELIGALMEVLGPSGVTDDVRKLASQINDYDFEDAQETFRRISEDLERSAQLSDFKSGDRETKPER